MINKEIKDVIIKLDELIREYDASFWHVYNCLNPATCPFCEYEKERMDEVLEEIKKIPEINIEYEFLTSKYIPYPAGYIIGMIEFGERYGTTVPEMVERDKILVSYDFKYLLIGNGIPGHDTKIFLIKSMELKKVSYSSSK